MQSMIKDMKYNMPRNRRISSVYLKDSDLEGLHISPAGYRNRSAALRLALDRYLNLLKTETRRVRAMFSDAEWQDLLTLTIGEVPAEAMRQYYAMQVEDCLPNELTSNRDELLRKLRTLSPLQDTALADMLEAEKFGK